MNSSNTFLDDWLLTELCKELFIFLEKKERDREWLKERFK